jgi:hypothetical protein
MDIGAACVKSGDWSHEFDGSFFTKQQLDDYRWPDPFWPSPSLRQPRPGDGFDDHKFQLSRQVMRYSSPLGPNLFGSIGYELRTRCNVDIFNRIHKWDKLASNHHEQLRLRHNLGISPIFSTVSPLLWKRAITPSLLTNKLLIFFDILCAHIKRWLCASTKQSAQSSKKMASEGTI